MPIYSVIIRNYKNWIPVLYVDVAYVMEMERKLQSLCMLSFIMSIKINIYSSSFDIFSPGLLCGPLTGIDTN